MIIQPGLPMLIVTPMISTMNFWMQHLQQEDKMSIRDLRIWEPGQARPTPPVNARVSSGNHHSQRVGRQLMAAGSSAYNVTLSGHLVPCERRTLCHRHRRHDEHGCRSQRRQQRADVQPCMWLPGSQHSLHQDRGPIGAVTINGTKLTPTTTWPTTP